MGLEGADVGVKGKLVLALVLLAVSAAVASDGAQLPFNLNDPTTWMPIAAAIIVIHLTLVSIIYMVASTFQDEQLKAWGKNEVMQAVFSAIIIASIGATIAVFDNEIIQPFFAGVVKPECNPSADPLCHQLRTDLKYDPNRNRWSEGNANVHITVEGDRVVCKGLDNCDPKFLMARSYLGITYEKLAKVLEHFIYDYNTYTALDSMGFNFGMSWTWKIEPPPIIGFNVGGSFPNHAILLNTLDNSIHFIERLMMLIKFQESVLKFFEYGLAASLIIIGIFFRSIWIFRKAGGLFISMGVCFMFVLPTLYALGWYTIDIPTFAGISEQAEEEADQSLLEEAMDATGISGIVDFIEKIGKTRGDMGTMNAVMAVVMSVVTAGFITLRVLEASQIKTMVPAAIKATLDTIVIGSMMATFISIAWLHVVDADDLYTTSLDDPGYLDIISRYAIVAIALPLLNFYITFSFIRGMSPLFGGDAEIPGLSRLL
ncbi:MAG: hypothetical protein QXU54_00940 [Candidatus Micrarchaeia archaeon]